MSGGSGTGRPKPCADTVAPEGGGEAHKRQDKMEIIENEGILHEVKIFPCGLQEKRPMQLSLTDPDTLFEELLQDLPPETVQMARACKAFVRAKKVKTPEQLLRVVFCGLDKP